MSSLSSSTRGDEVSSCFLGEGRYSWAVGPGQVDLSMPPPPPLNIEIDLKRSAIIIIDMQNNFCAPGGLTDQQGFDLTPERAPIAPLKAILPQLRSAGVPIIWLNWGNRPDRKNLPPTALYAFNRDGRGPGIGGTLPDGHGRILEKGSWSAAVTAAACRLRSRRAHRRRRTHRPPSAPAPC